MQLRIAIHPTATTGYESSLVELTCGNAVYPLDMNFTALLRHVPNPSPRALDLLFIASCVYAADKAVLREDEANSEDKWKRRLEMTLPVTDPEAWQGVGEHLANTLNFLTGDQWAIQFEMACRKLVQRKVRRRRRRRGITPLVGDAVSLFSGGLDSYIGAIDYLARNPTNSLALVGHYDGDIGGPSMDQDTLADCLKTTFPSRFSRLKCRIGLSEAGVEHSYRSRSFLFLALAVVAAESIGRGIPIIVPENGPIALNPPLIPSRRGSCSTRTTHPHFLSSFESLLARAGMPHPVNNPYRVVTKGEMVAACAERELLQKSYAVSRSCAKAGYKMHWKSKGARQCGLCVPCLFRRAALNTLGWDNEIYGTDIGDTTICRDELENDAFADTRALAAFIFRNDPEQRIQRDLLTNGPIPFSDLKAYSDLIIRMRTEVRTWMAARSMQFVQERAGLQRAA